jgi:hypothetical protein
MQKVNFELNRVSVSPYGPASGPKLKKKKKKYSCKCGFRKKNPKRGCAHGDNMVVYGKSEVNFIEK